MEALQLFTTETAGRGTKAGRPRSSRVAEEIDAAMWHETELFLADHVEREGDVAHIQVALAACDALGGRSRSNLEEVVVDRARFPRTAHAVARVLELLDIPDDARPDGFWPRFLLDQLDSDPTP